MRFTRLPIDLTLVFAFDFYAFALRLTCVTCACIVDFHLTPAVVFELRFLRLTSAIFFAYLKHQKGFLSCKTVTSKKHMSYMNTENNTVREVLLKPNNA